MHTAYKCLNLPEFDIIVTNKQSKYYLQFELDSYEYWKNLNVHKMRSI